MKSHYKIILCSCIGMGLIYVLCNGYAFAADDKVKEPVITQQEKAEYEKLSSKNAEAKQIFNDLQIFAVLSHEITKFFPESKEIRGVTVPVRKIMQGVVGVMYNVSELGLGIIKIMDEQSEQLNGAVACLKYTDEELLAAKNGKFVDEQIRTCAKFGCGGKKACIASSIKKISLAIKTVFDPAVVKYVPETETSERGLLMNIDLVINELVQILLKSQIIRDGLNKVKTGGAQNADDFLKNIDRLRRIIIPTGQAFSGILEALIIAAGQLAPESVTPAELEKHKEVFQTANTEKTPIDEKALDDLLLEFE